MIARRPLGRSWQKTTCSCPGPALAVRAAGEGNTFVTVVTPFAFWWVRVTWKTPGRPAWGGAGPDPTLSLRRTSDDLVIRRTCTPPRGRATIRTCDPTRLICASTNRSLRSATPRAGTGLSTPPPRSGPGGPPRWTPSRARRSAGDPRPASRERSGLRPLGRRRYLHLPLADAAALLARAGPAAVHRPAAA